MELVQSTGGETSNYENWMVLDCSNGVGALPMQTITDRVRSYIDIQLINTNMDTPTILNEGCGAEFVHKDVKLPSELTEEAPIKCASFDGDADRLIYFKRTSDGPVIVDGDK